MLKNIVIAVLLAGTLAFVAFFIMGQRDGEPEQALSPQPETNSDPVGSPANTALDPAAQDAPTLKSAAPHSTAHREEVQTPITGKSIPVLVRGPDGPMANFQIMAFTEARTVRTKHFADLQQADRIMAEHGSVFTTSDRGLVHFPIQPGSTLLMLGRTDELWGSLIVLPGTIEQQVLELSPDFSVRAQVLAPGNRPMAGVTVEIRSTGEGSSQIIGRTETEGPDGIAHFPHAQELTHNDLPGLQLSFQVDALTAEPIAAPLDFASEQVTPLYLPATGRVLVSVLDEFGSLLQGRKGEVGLSAIPPGENRVPSGFDNRSRATLLRKAVDGLAVFAHVQIGLELGAEVQRNGSGVPDRVFGPGPVIEGETLSMEVRLGSDHPVLRMRAVDGAGTALVNRVLFVEKELVGNIYFGTSKSSVRTGAEGFFVLDLETLAPGTSTHFRFTLGQSAGSIHVQAGLANGLNDLGDVVIAPLQVFAGGRFESDLGQPVARVKIVLRASNASGDWGRNRDIEAATDQDGQFSIKKPLLGERFQIAGLADGFSCLWQDFDAGQADLVVPMRAAGQIMGRVLLDEEFPRELILLRINADALDVEYLPSGSLATQLEQDGSFVFENLAPGLRTVRLLAVRQTGDIRRIPDVLVKKGEASRDKRLALIDLREQLFAHELTLVGASPEEQLSGKVSFGPAGSDIYANYLWMVGNIAELLSTERSIRVSIQVRGYRTEKLGLLSGPTTVQLRKSPTVTIALVGSAQVPKAPLFLRAGLVPAGSRGLVPDYAGNHFGKTREIQVPLSRFGRMQVEWLITRSSGGGAIGMTGKIERKQIVEVTEQDSPQRIEVQLTQEELDAFISQLEGS